MDELDPSPDAIADVITLTADESAGDVDGNVLANDQNLDAATDVDEVGGDPANVGVVVTGSNGGSAIINADGSFDFEAGGDFDDLAVGQSDETTFTYGLTFTGAAADIDIVLLQDLSGSFDDDLPNIQAQFSSLYDTLNEGERTADFAVASFIDKPFDPFGASDDFVYKTDLSLTDDKAAVQAALDGLTVGDGGDTAEAQLEALLQVAARAEGEVDLGTDQRFVVISTDDAFHFAGQYPGGADGPNDGDAEVEDEDYPSVAQVRQALEDANITPIFSVTSDVLQTYEDLVAELGRGIVVELSSDSSNIADAIVGALGGVVTTDTATVTVTVEGTKACDEINATAPSETFIYNGGCLVVNGFDSHGDILEATFDTLEVNFGSETVLLNSAQSFIDFALALALDGDDATDTVYEVEEGAFGFILSRDADGNVDNGIIFADALGDVFPELLPEDGPPSPGATPSDVTSSESYDFCGFFDVAPLV